MIGDSMPSKTAARSNKTHAEGFDKNEKQWKKTGKPALPVAQSIDELQKLLGDSGEPSVENETYWQIVRAQFPFKSEMLYLNNGTIGIQPQVVLQSQLDMISHQEIDPWGAMPNRWPSPNEARQKTADLLNCSPSELAFTRNSTESMNIIAMGLNLNSDDEILTTTHEHHGGWSCWQNRHDQFGNPLRKIDLHDPPEDEDEILEIFRQAIRPETRILSLCHVTCTTVWRLPVKKICRMARKQGIITVVDGAQSVGMIGVDLKDIGCDFYASSTHKWLFTPKGTGILYIHEGAEDKISGGYHVPRGREARLTAARFENHASQSAAPMVGFGVAVDFHNAIGTTLVADRGATMAAYLKKKLMEIPGVRVLTPMSRKLSASMVSLAIGGMTSNDIGHPLRQRYNIETRGLHEGAYHGVRVSCAMHNTYEELDILISAIGEIAENRV